MVCITEQSLSNLTFMNSSFPGCSLKWAWRLRVIMQSYSDVFLFVFTFGKFKIFHLCPGVGWLLYQGSFPSFLLASLFLCSSGWKNKSHTMSPTLYNTFTCRPPLLIKYTKTLQYTNECRETINKACINCPHYTQRRTLPNWCFCIHVKFTFAQGSINEKVKKEMDVKYLL